MTIFSEARPREPNRFLSLIIDHNPFYLFSAVLMLLGAFMVNNAQEMKAGDIAKLLILLAILNVYEILVILLGRVLIWKAAVPRDGMTLLILESLFFVDGTFLSSETVLARFALGACINIALLLLAVGKTVIILKTIRVRITAPLLGFLGLQLTALFLLPVILELAGSDHSVELVLFAAWWVAGLMPLAFDLLSRAFAPQMAASSGMPGKSRVIRLVYVIAPFFSLVAHIAFMHWVYKADFYPAELAPILLGLTISLARIPYPHLTRIWRLALPVVALLISLPNPIALHVELVDGFPALSPLRAAMAGAYFTLAYVFFFQYLLYFAAGGLMLMGFVIFGPTWSTIIQYLDECRGVLARLIPKTAGAWGVVSIVFSFAFLAVGAVVSWLSYRREEPELDGPPSVPPAV